MSLLWKEVADFGLRVTILGLNCPTKSKRIERKGCGVRLAIMEFWKNGMMEKPCCGLQVAGYELQVASCESLKQRV